MKKVIFIFLLFFCMSLFAEGKPSENNEFLYLVSKEEMSDFMQAYNWLKQWENAEIEVSDENFAKLYEIHIGKENLISMLFENFFRHTNNKKIQTQIKEYIQKNNLNNSLLEKSLLKKIDSTQEKYEQSGKELIKYSYQNLEFDENINLFDFDEVHPFNDELGLLLFANDWQVLTIHSTETDEPSDEKSFLILSGGGTNSIMISFDEIDNITVNSKEDIQKISRINSVANKYKDNWHFLELDKVGILENCGVDNYFIGYGIGSDLFIPEIENGDFVVCMYKKSTNKVYVINTFMNFSKINISYEIRNRLYNYLLFFTLFCYCD